MADDRQTIADQVFAALGGKKGDVSVLCLKCDLIEYVVMEPLRGGGVGAWTCAGCGQRHNVRLNRSDPRRERIQTKLEENEWVS